jgi:hypothetical protein
VRVAVSQVNGSGSIKSVDLWRQSAPKGAPPKNPNRSGDSFGFRRGEHDLSVTLQLATEPPQ